MTKLFSAISRDAKIGIAGAALTVLALVGSAVAYLVPFGEQTYIAEFRHTGGARSGDEVRIAGIKVGKVQTVDLVGDHVEVVFGVDRSVRLGDLSTAEVKLLTPIGGHYLALESKGANDLGDKHIPAERTRTPFELTDIFEAVTPGLRKANGKTLRDTMLEIDRGLAGQPEAVRQILGAVNDLAGVLAQRSGQLDKAVQVSGEYVGATARDKAVLAEFVGQLGLIADKLDRNQGELVAAFDLLTRALAVLHRPLVAYGDGVEPAVTQLEQAFQKVWADPNQLRTVIETLRGFITTVTPMLGIADAQPVVAEPGLCVPTPIRGC
ncbi:MlaD family protein [Nocardia sp. XZ_19_385]|uniref:MlaD family protein n=1 Tax=Nocardia sp. XZ_19_385 TaxID=2769488 RepID=UPI00188E5433|nr:MlaD family protein [Nocardia sp. XZ_19_385]